MPSSAEECTALRQRGTRLRESEKLEAKDIADRISRLRRARGWKQKELAAKIDSSLYQISKMERGRYIPRAATLLRLAEALSVTVDFLLTGRSPRLPQGDPRLRERLPALDRLPEAQRDSLILFLDAFLASHAPASQVSRHPSPGRREGDAQ
jgi:transcriptional regulator with XRE-family HTH domain